MTAAQNMAVDSVLLDMCARGVSPPTLRFLQFNPPAVLVGSFQRVEDEAREDYCREKGIDINRRITGGGAIFFDRTQLGWEVICRWSDIGVSRPSAGMFEKICEPVVTALKKLGINASYRPRNDIEVDGRKISGTGGTEKLDALLFQGTLLIDFDADTMVRALRVPVEKLRKREIESMRDRITWMSAEMENVPALSHIKSVIAGQFSSSFCCEMNESGLLMQEEEMLGEELSRFESAGWIRGRKTRSSTQFRALYPTKTGTLKVALVCSEKADRIQSVMFEGDFFCFPRRGLFDLEAALKGTSVKSLRENVETFFAYNNMDMGGIGSEDVCLAVREALSRAEWSRFGIDVEKANSVFTVGGDFEHIASLGPKHLLLPYCAKPVACESRHTDSCDMCGECGIGESYETAYENGLIPISITSYEHLIQTIKKIKQEGAAAYLGSCCEAFYIKHRQDMEEAGLPGILFDVAGSETCYDLGKQSFAYRGEFEGETQMDLDLLEAVLSACRKIRRESK